MHITAFLQVNRAFLTLLTTFTFPNKKFNATVLEETASSNVCIQSNIIPFICLYGYWNDYLLRSTLMHFLYLIVKI